MRKLIAIVALLCGAASVYAAEPQKWCSSGFDKPAELIASKDGAFPVYILKVAGHPDEVFREDALPTPGFLLPLEGDEGDKQQVLVVQDRVFWPCP